MAARPHGTPSTASPPHAGTAIDAEARARTRTLYLPQGAVPMFPEALAEGAFSLGAADASKPTASGGAPLDCALSIGIELSEDGAIALYEVVPSLVRVTNRMTYDEADADIALGPGACSHPALQALYGLARLRKGWRAARGSIDIDTPEVGGPGHLLVVCLLGGGQGMVSRAQGPLGPAALRGLGGACAPSLSAHPPTRPLRPPGQGGGGRRRAGRAAACGQD